jgi:hypothetical protein
MSADRFSFGEVVLRPRLPLLILILCGFPGLAQRTTQPPPAPGARGDTSPMGDEDEARARISREMAKKANQERLAALKTDTDKLLKLSVELKSYVDKSNENVLSLDVIKRADEIEKLAHSVKDKMKGPN